MPATTSGAPEHIPYTVTSQEKTEKLTPDGRFENVWRIGFRGPSGVHSFVEVPEHQFTAANVDLMIEAELDTIMGVHGLGEQPHPDNLAS